MLGSKIFTFGPKSGTPGAAALLDAAAPPGEGQCKGQGRNTPGEKAANAPGGLRVHKDDVGIEHGPTFFATG